MRYSFCNHIKYGMFYLPSMKIGVCIAGLNEASFLEGAIEGSSNDSSLMEADDIQLRAVESDESL